MIKNDNSGADKPQVFAVKRDSKGVSLSRRSFISAGAMAVAAGTFSGCGKEEENTPEEMLMAHSGDVNSVAFSPDGKYLASGGDDSRVKLWEVPGGDLVDINNSYTDDIKTVVFSPDSSHLAYMSYASIWVWPMKRDLALKRIYSTTDLSALAFSPDSSLIAYGGRGNPRNEAPEGAINIWTVADEEYLSSVEGHNILLNSLAFHPGGRKLASASADKTIKTWSFPDGKLLNTLEGNELGIASVVYSPDGTLLAAKDQDKTIKLLSSESGKLKTTLSHSGEGLMSSTFVFSPDGNLIATCGRNCIDLWSVADGELLKTIEDVKGVKSVAFSPDGRFLATGGRNGYLLLWSMPDGKFIKNIFDPECSVNTEMNELSQMGRSGGSSDICTCDTVMVYGGKNIPGNSTCVCNTITVGDRKSIYNNGGGSSGGSSSYWYPN